jgi:hypothetical protein
MRNPHFSCDGAVQERYQPSPLCCDRSSCATDPVDRNQAEQDHRGIYCPDWPILPEFGTVQATDALSLSYTQAKPETGTDMDSHFPEIPKMALVANADSALGFPMLV